MVTCEDTMVVRAKTVSCYKLTVTCYKLFAKNVTESNEQSYHRVAREQYVRTV